MALDRFYAGGGVSWLDYYAAYSKVADFHVQ
jgi:hypothetical protein